MKIEKVDDHGEADLLWLLHKVPETGELWFPGQLKIVNDGEKNYMVIILY